MRPLLCRHLRTTELKLAPQSVGTPPTSEGPGAQIQSPKSAEQAVQLLGASHHRRVTLGANLGNFRRGPGASDLLDPDRFVWSDIERKG